MKILWIIFSVACLFSCGNQEEVSVTKIKINASYALESAFNGGVMLYGRNLDKNIIMALDFKHENSEREVIVPRGTWEFILLGWEGVTLMTGTNRCDEGVRTISQAEETLEFYLSSANCVAESVSNHVDDYSGDQFLPVQINLCKSLIGGGCSVINSQAASARIILPEVLPFQKKFDNLYEGLSSTCYVITAGTSGNSINIPVGSEMLPGEVGAYPTIIEVFEEPACIGGSQLYLFPNGIYNGELRPLYSDLSLTPPSFASVNLRYAKRRGIDVFPAGQYKFLPTVASIPQYMTFVVKNNTGKVVDFTSSISLAYNPSSYFYIEGNTCPVNFMPGGSCTVTIRYQPVGVGLHQAMLGFYDQSDMRFETYIDLSGECI